MPLPDRPVGHAPRSLLSRAQGSRLFRSRPSSRYASVLHPPPHPRGWRAYLAARSSLAKFGFVLLALFSLGCLWLSVSGLATSDDIAVPPSPARSDSQGRPEDEAAPPSPYYIPGTSDLDHLILVPGKAIWAGVSFAGHTQPSNWFADEFHKSDAVESYWHQIERGIELANADPQSLLIFSGGQSYTQVHTAVTEAASYFQLALESPMDVPVLPGVSLDGNAHAPVTLLPHGIEGIRSLRMVTEPYALDTFENLLFAIARFREITNHYPQRISIVENKLYQDRFETLHTKAIRWPHDILAGHKRFNFVGLDEPGDNSSERVRHEMENDFKLFDKDMYGCHDPLLVRVQCALRIPAGQLTIQFLPGSATSPQSREEIAIVSRLGTRNV